MIKEKVKSIKEEKREDVEMIVAMINRGYSDFVIDASRDAGATGATVLYGRSSIKKDDDFLNGVPIQAEKEIILILVKKSLRKKVMQEIATEHISKKRGMVFVFACQLAVLWDSHHLRKSH